MMTNKFEQLYDECVNENLLSRAMRIGALSTGLLAIPMPVGAMTNVPQAAQRIDKKEYLKDLIDMEGSMKYQASKGTFKNNLFFPYKDSLGYNTIGYGHKILKGEDYSKGISRVKAALLLQQDSEKAWMAAQNIIVQHNIKNTPANQRVLANMAFQLGQSGVSGFKKTLAALSKNDYNNAVKHMKNSKWYRQTPSRVNTLASILLHQK